MGAAPLTLHQMAALSFLPGVENLLPDDCFSHQKLYHSTGQLLAQVERGHSNLLQQANLDKKPPGQRLSA